MSGKHAEMGEDPAQARQHDRHWFLVMADGMTWLITAGLCAAASELVSHFTNQTLGQIFDAIAVPTAILALLTGMCLVTEPRHGDALNRLRRTVRWLMFGSLAPLTGLVVVRVMRWPGGSVMLGLTIGCLLLSTALAIWVLCQSLTLVAGRATIIMQRIIRWGVLASVVTIMLTAAAFKLDPALGKWQGPRMDAIVTGTSSVAGLLYLWLMVLMVWYRWKFKRLGEGASA